MKRQRGAFVIGGRRSVAEAVRAGRAERVLTAAAARSGEALREVLGLARAAGLPVERADLDALRLRDHQGVAALVRLPGELDERALATRAFDQDAFVVALDGVMDPQNMGAAARSAEAAGAAAMVVRRRRAAPTTPAAVRASAGALLHLPVARVANIPRALERLRDRGFFVVGLDQDAPVAMHDAGPPPRPLVLVVGSEDEGISRLVRETCDLLVAIPMRGRTASLNASAALAVGLFGYALRPALP